MKCMTPLSITDVLYENILCHKYIIIVAYHWDKSEAFLKTCRFKILNLQKKSDFCELSANKSQNLS
jgi:hypothetical protein